jgi:SAM-dependent methyltransferase
MQYEAYWRLRPKLTPGLENSQMHYARMLEAAAAAASSWLDLGCGFDFVRNGATFTMPAGNCRAVGLDMDATALRQHTRLSQRVVGNGETLPFGRGTFDLVTMNMVMEHVKTPRLLFAEVNRVLRPGGVLLLHTPNAVGYTTLATRMVPTALRAPLAARIQGRTEDDLYPTYYRANSVKDLRRLGKNNGLEVQQIEQIESSPMFASVPILLLPELMFIRLLRTMRLHSMRPCLLARFRKPQHETSDLQGGSGRAITTAAADAQHLHST